MQKMKLTYFDIKGNRGQTARLAFEIAGVDFEDIRLSFPEFRELKSQYPFGAVPVLEVDGQMFSQSNGINRYVGKLCNLYPDDPLQAAYCDEAMGGVEEIGTRLAATMRLGDEDKKRVRTELSENEIPRYLKGLEGCLKRRGGEYFADGRLTVADLKSFVLLQWLQGPLLDHVPRDIVAKQAPLLVEHHARIWDRPKIRAHYDAD